MFLMQYVVHNSNKSVSQPFRAAYVNGVAGKMPRGKQNLGRKNENIKIMSNWVL